MIFLYISIQAEGPGVARGKEIFMKQIKILFFSLCHPRFTHECPQQSFHLVLLYRYIIYIYKVTHKKMTTNYSLNMRKRWLNFVFLFIKDILIDFAKKKTSFTFCWVTALIPFLIKKLKNKCFTDISSNVKDRKKSLSELAR